MNVSTRQLIGLGVVVGLGAVLVVGVVAFVLGERHAAASLAIARVGPNQVAGAMQGDDFYARYGDSTLVLTGTVASIVADHGHTIVGFQTTTA